MNNEQLKEKLEGMDYAEVYEIWDKYCRPESFELWQLIDDIVNLANHDDDVHDELLKIQNIKKLTDTERLEIALSLLDDEQGDEYAQRCVELEHGCERNGFYNVPAECEDEECAKCSIKDEERRKIDCPYVD